MKKAILLSAGFGKRLRPFTDNTPKPLMSINGKPLLSIWLKRLVGFGFNSFLINSHYLSEQIKSFIDKSEFKKLITYSYEEKILGTAGTIINNYEYFKNGGLLAHADNYCLANFKNFYKAHQNRPKSCLMTMMTFKTSNPLKCGIVEIDKSQIVRKFYEKDKNSKGDIANAAIYLISDTMMDEIKNNYSNCSDFSTEIIPNFVDRIFTYHSSSPLIDIGTIDDFNLANKIDKGKI